MQSLTKTADELRNDPRRIDDAQICAGDTIEYWVPVRVGTKAPYMRHPDGLMKLQSVSVACRNDLDLGGRWTDENDLLVHGSVLTNPERDSIRGTSRYGILIRVASGATSKA